MTRFVLLCALLLPLSGCDFFAELFGPNEPPVAPPEPVPVDLPVFTRTLRGDGNDNFATITLYRNAFTQSRLVLLALRQLDAVDLDLALPDCLKLTEGSNTGSYQWKQILVPPGTYEKVVDWARFAPNCAPHGTLFFTVSAGPHGEAGSIPFEWLEFTD